MTLLDCGHEPSPHDSFTTGYGTDNKGRTSCYICCADHDREDMAKTGRATLYMVDGGITNWPGSLRFNIRELRTGRHNIAKVRYDAWFEGPDGMLWHAVSYGNNTDIAHCKRTKQEVN